MNKDDEITYFAETDARNKRVRFGIKAKDRTKHIYAIGKTGMGKSTMLETMAIQDIQNGNGLAFLDPHGSTADKLLEYVPEHRIKDVIYFAPFDLDFPISFNVMEDVGADKRHLVAAGLMSAFKKIWVDAWSARMEYILNNTILALLEYPDSTLISINRMLADKEYRKMVVDNVTDPAVKSFWIDEFGKYTDKFAAEATPAIQNKIGQFISNPLIRNIIGQPNTSFDVRGIMDNSKILIMNLSKGRLGEGNANLLGSMLITKIYLGAMSRADVKSTDMKALPNFYFYVDEFQNFANESFAGILSEARKYKLNLTIAHQYIEQMTDEVRAAVFGNVGTMISFRVGAYDAEVLEKEFAPVFTAEDMVNLGFTQIYLKLMIEGIGSQPFSARTLDTPPRPEKMFLDEIITNSRTMYAQPRKIVEEAITKWHEGGGDSKEKIPTNNREPIRMQSNQSPKVPYNSNPPRDNRGDNTRSNSPQGRDRSPDRHQGEHRDQRNREDRNNQPRNQNFNKPQESKVHHPFKEAIKSVPVPKEVTESPEDIQERENSLRQAVSLSFLKARADNEEQREKTREKEREKIKQDTKTPTPENLSSLRQALKDVLKEAGVTDKDNKPQVTSNNSQKTPFSKIEPPIPKPSSIQAKSIQETPKSEKKEAFEIPEEELLELLHVEKPE